MSTNVQGRKGTYLNGVLTVIAGLLVVAVVQSSVGLPGPRSVEAADRAAPVRSESISREPMGIPNASDQRVRMINSLDSIEARMARIEAKLSAPLDVKVIDMPETKTEGKKPE